jgi:hypothetical protein
VLPANVGRVRLLTIIEMVFLGLTAAMALGDALLLIWAGIEASSFAPKAASAVFGTVGPLSGWLTLYAFCAFAMIGVLVAGLIRLLDGRGGRQLIASPQIVLLGVWLFAVASGTPVDPGGWFLSVLLAAFPLVVIVLLRSPSVQTHAGGPLGRSAVID